ncbi:hypothetical protein LX36DRAFT_660238 [Colletotrichum falcatum]|nr:hypothetical protein LX36DRAFT_660238 [Colletotrichum falcatum]
MGETPKRLVVDRLFRGDREPGERFWDWPRNAEGPRHQVPGGGAGAGSPDEAQRVEEL